MAAPWETEAPPWEGNDGGTPSVIAPPWETDAPPWEQEEDSRSKLVAEKEKLAAQPDVTTFGGFTREVAERASQIPAGLAQLPAGTARAIAATADFLDRNVADLTPGSPTIEERALTRGADALERTIQKLPQPTERDLGHDFMQGVGQMGGMLAAGAGGKAIGLGRAGIAALGTAAGFGMEFDDAFRRSGERGDSPDLRFAKSMGYATVSSLMENRLGAGRLLRKYFPDPTAAAQKLTTLGVSKELIGNFLAGGAEEGAQQLAQNLIVEGTEEPFKDVGRSALVGSLVQGVTGAPSIGSTERGAGSGEVPIVTRPAEDALPPVAPPETSNIQHPTSNAEVIVQPPPAVPPPVTTAAPTAPATPTETDNERFAREQREASAALKQLKKQEAEEALTAEAIAKREPGTTSVDDVNAMSDAEITNLVKTRNPDGSPAYPPQRDSVVWGAQQGPEMLPKLEAELTKAAAAMKQTTADVMADMKAGRDSAANETANRAAQFRQAWIAGAMEGVKREGGNYRTAVESGLVKPKEVTTVEQTKEGQGRQKVLGDGGTPSLPVKVEARHLETARDMLTTEDAPDIYTLVDEVTSGPVRFDGPEFAEHHAGARAISKSKKGRNMQERSLARRRMSATEGLGADKVLNAIKAKYPKYENWTVQDLANAMLDDAEVRLNRNDPNRPEVLRKAAEIAAEETSNIQHPTSNAEQVNLPPEGDWTVNEQGAPGPGLYQQTLDVLDKGIAATQNDLTGLQEGITGLPVWGTKAILNAALKIMREAFVRTRDLAMAINAGLEYLRGLKLPGYNEAEAEQFLKENLKERKFNAQLEAAEAQGDIGEGTFSNVENRLYFQRPQEPIIQAQSRAIELVGGPREAVRRWQELTNGVKPDEQVALGALIIRQLGVIERAAKARGDAQLERDVALEGAQFIDEQFTRYATELGQGVSMFKSFLAMSPQMKFIWGRNRIERARQAVTTLVAPDVKSSAEAMTTINAQGIETATADPTVQATAKAAVDAALQQQAETPGTELRNAIRKEVVDELVRAGIMTTREAEITVLHMDGGAGGTTLAQKFASAGIADPVTRAKRLLEQLGVKMKEATTKKLKVRTEKAKAEAREKAKEKAEALKEAKVTWIRQARSIPDREREAAAVKLAADASAAAAGGNRPALQLFYQRLTNELRRLFPLRPNQGAGGLTDMELIREVLTNPDKFADVWQQTATEIRAKFGIEGMADVNRTLGKLTPEAILEYGLANPVDRIVMQGVRDTQLNMSRIIRQHHTQQDATGRALATKLATEAALPQDMADKLAAAIQRRFAAIVTRAKESALKRLLRPIVHRDLAKPGLAQKIIEATNAGQLSQEQYWNVVKERLKLPAWSKAVSDDVQRRVDELEAIPDSQQDRKNAAMQAMLTELDKAAGYTMLDLGQAFFITNLMFGINTHAANVLGNTANTLATAAAEGAQLLFEGRPLDALTAMEAVFRGRRQTAGNIAGVALTGQTPALRSVKAEPGHVLEAMQFGRKGGVPLKGETRAQDIGRALLETRLASVLNLWKANGRALAAEDLLFFTPAYQAKLAILTTRLYRQQGMKGREARQKASEILGFGQPAVEAAQQQAEREGFTSHEKWRRIAEILESRVPEHLRETAREYALRVTLNNQPYGMLGEVAKMVQSAKRSESAPLRVAATAIAPIINIPVNWFNESLNYSPVGFVRLLRGKAYGQEAKNITPEQWRDLRAEVASKAAMGTMLLAGLALKYWPDKDDKDRAPIAIYGSGPMSPADREGWKARGNIPYSVRVGNQSYSYALTPFAVPLSIIANMMDRYRDKNLYHVPAAGRALDKLATLAGYSLVQAGATMLDQSFMLGISDFMETLREENPERAAVQLAKTMARAGTSIVIPQEIRAIDKRLDPRVYHAQDAGAALVEALPFVRREGNVALNALGQEIAWPPGKRFTSTLNDNKAVNLLADLGAWPSVPDRHQKYTLRAGRELSDEEYAEYVRKAGTNAARVLDKVADAPDKLVAIYAAAHPELPLKLLVELAAQPDLAERKRMIQRAAIADIISTSRTAARQEMGLSE